MATLGYSLSAIGPLAGLIPNTRHWPGAETMSKERSPKKETKKKPEHNLKEKRAAKKSKEDNRSA
jgi:hypothetical protein